MSTKQQVATIGYLNGYMQKKAEDKPGTVAKNTPEAFYATTSAGKAAPGKKAVEAFNAARKNSPVLNRYDDLMGNLYAPKGEGSFLDKLTPEQKKIGAAMAVLLAAGAGAYGVNKMMNPELDPATKEQAKKRALKKAEAVA